MSQPQNIRVNMYQPGGRRPGPFGPASALLPMDQQPVVISEQTIAADALERMVDTGYSQLPVESEERKITGVFSWQSFGRRVSELRETSIDVLQLPVKDTDLEAPHFISADTYIDTTTDWGQIDYILVGEPHNLIGVLSISDVLGRLNDFAEAFVLLFEIEHELRDLITDVYTAEELTAVFDRLSRPDVTPIESAIQGLNELVAGDDPPVADMKQVKKVSFAVNLLKRGAQSRPVTQLEDFTFSQYREVICNKDNWPRFEPVFDTLREIVNADFEEVNKIRNVVFHFRRGVIPKDTDRLRRFREKLRYNRDLWRAQRAEPVTGQ